MCVAGAHRGIPDEAGYAPTRDALRTCEPLVLDSFLICRAQPGTKAHVSVKVK